MSENVRINFKVVGEKIREISNSLMQYQEIYNSELNKISLVNDDLESAASIAMDRINELKRELTDVSCMADKSEEARVLVKENEARIQELTKVLIEIRKHQDNIIKYAYEINSMKKDIDEMSSNQFVLQNKINELLTSKAKTF